IRPQTPALPDGRDHLAAASQRPLAYVSFGTVALYQPRPQLITAAVRALLARGLDAVVTTSDPVLTARLTALSPQRVHVERWLSLPTVLERCSLAVCHGGAGTVLAALAGGVPLLLLPQGAPSQARMSNACARRGVARVIGSQTPDTITLLDGLEQLITDDRLKTAAREVAAEIQAMPGAAAAATAIEALITP
ncbi:MAG TPA: nucleotide disphospho-sugar-binding domain-containing protein, partial [Solirubrobacteraceae bacterium]|nr:nucleotide disphospho-sugar-binding domain-containing protein [Solirubrobacteraceae bacterium]